MKRALTVLLAAAALILTVAPAASAHRLYYRAPSMEGRYGYHPRVRPHKFYFFNRGPAVWLHGLRWQHWGRTGAEGTGHLKSCDDGRCYNLGHHVSIRFYDPTPFGTNAPPHIFQVATIRGSRNLCARGTHKVTLIYEFSTAVNPYGQWTCRSSGQ